MALASATVFSWLKNWANYATCLNSALRLVFGQWHFHYPQEHPRVPHVCLNNMFAVRSSQETSLGGCVESVENRCASNDTAVGRDGLCSLWDLKVAPDLSWLQAGRQTLGEDRASREVS